MSGQSIKGTNAEGGRNAEGKRSGKKSAASTDELSFTGVPRPCVSCTRMSCTDQSQVSQHLANDAGRVLIFRLGPLVSFRNPADDF